MIIEENENEELRAIRFRWTCRRPGCKFFMDGSRDTVAAAKIEHTNNSHPEAADV